MDIMEFYFNLLFHYPKEILHWAFSVTLGPTDCDEERHILAAAKGNAYQQPGTVRGRDAEQPPH